jgi:sarcosine oxidase subunit delta
MKVMRCPLNGERNIQEFAYIGPVKDMPDPTTATDRVWAEHVLFRPNPPGLIREWWCHTPTNNIFIAERDTVTDRVIRTYPAAELFSTRIDFPAAESG